MSAILRGRGGEGGDVAGAVGAANVVEHLLLALDGGDPILGRGGFGDIQKLIPDFPRDGGFRKQHSHVQDGAGREENSTAIIHLEIAVVIDA